MKKKVLVTGATGFVGYHLIIEALQSDLDVYAAVRPTSNIDHLSSLNISYTTLDYSSVEKLQKEIEDKQYHYIIHAAGITKAKTAEDYNRINAKFSKNLAIAACQADLPLEKFIYVSSLAAIGPLSDPIIEIDEKTVPQPLTNYGRSKLLAEQYLSEMRRLPLLVIRPTAVYGPREKDILILFKSLNKGLELYIGKSEQQLSFVYVKDLAKVIIHSLTSEFVHTAYNISDGEVYDRYALSETAKRVLNKRTIKFRIPVSIVNIMAIFLEKLYESRTGTPALNKEKIKELTAINWSCNISRAREELGYSPQITLEAGLVETLDWYKRHKWL